MLSKIPYRRASLLGYTVSSRHESDIHPERNTEFHQSDSIVSSIPISPFVVWYVAL